MPHFCEHGLLHADSPLRCEMRVTPHYHGLRSSLYVCTGAPPATVLEWTHCSLEGLWTWCLQAYMLSRIDEQGHMYSIHLEPSFEAQQPHMAHGHWTAQAEPEHSVVSPTEALTSKHFILVITAILTRRSETSFSSFSCIENKRQRNGNALCPSA